MPSRRLECARIDAGEAKIAQIKIAQIQHLDERIDHANRIAVVDPVVGIPATASLAPDPSPQQRPASCPRRFSRRTIAG